MIEASFGEGLVAYFTDEGKLLLVYKLDVVVKSVLSRVDLAAVRAHLFGLRSMVPEENQNYD